MYIANIAFSLNWFLTIPGMLISGGVLLLIIALIMMIVSSNQNKTEIKEEKKEEVVAPVNNVEVAPTPVTPVVEESVADPVVEAPVVMEAPLGPIEETPINMGSIVPEVNPVETVIDPVVSVEPVVPIEPVAIIEPSLPVTPEVPVIEPVVPVAPVVEPVQEVLPEIAPIPVIEPVILTENIVEEVPLETPDATNLEKTSVNIYGGNPIPPIPHVEEAPRPIYGGADPLEATQKLPKIDVHHEPYSTRIESAPIEMPSLEPVTPSVIPPVQAQVVQIPDIEEL